MWAVSAATEFYAACTVQLVSLSLTFTATSTEHLTLHNNGRLRVDFEFSASEDEINICCPSNDDDRHSTFILMLMLMLRTKLQKYCFSSFFSWQHHTAFVFSRLCKKNNSRAARRLLMDLTWSTCTEDLFGIFCCSSHSIIFYCLWWVHSYWCWV